MKTYSTKEASAVSGKSLTAIKNAIAKGYLKATKIGQRAYAITPTALKRWLNRPEYHKRGRKAKKGAVARKKGGAV